MITESKLGVEEDRYKVLLVWLVAGIDGDDFPPQLAGAFRAIHRIAGGGVLRESGFAHAVQDDPQGKVSLRKGIADAISFQKRNDNRGAARMPGAVKAGAKRSGKRNKCWGTRGGNRLCRISREP